MYCPNCGKQIDDNAAYCLGCGVEISTMIKPAQGKVSAGWWWLGFFLPTVGLLVWAFSQDTEPVKAKKCGWGALIGTITTVVAVILLYIFMFAITFWLAGSFGNYYYHGML